LQQNNPYQDFQTWYDEYFSFIYLFLVGYFDKRHVPISEAEVEDLVQNTFLAILERKTNTPIEFPLAYLKQCAISQASLCIAQKKKALAPELTEQLQHCAAPIQMERDESDQQVWRLLQKILNPMESTLVYQRVVQHYSYKEIAAQGNMPNEQQLHSMYHRAKIKLHHYLKNNYFDKA
jgi:DNA-directed RNA polymerase specialized sigma24 family protein